MSTGITSLCTRQQTQHLGLPRHRPGQYAGEAQRRVHPLRSGAGGMVLVEHRVEHFEHRGDRRVLRAVLGQTEVMRDVMRATCATTLADSMRQIAAMAEPWTAVALVMRGGVPRRDFIKLDPIFPGVPKPAAPEAK